ncbi:hypothetical protein V7200_08640 [Cytobacillus firmus]|uniref:Uncharacterized protein n=1 Tax=Cytobacillus firmus TaxID=1399 RepID=A0A800N8Y6_CYTFI|nr:hypothetical protein [Cytobacillus firmus]KAF0822380.1 hypothetical protein KIS1582_3868 [Cytobacillus firmus]
MQVGLLDEQGMSLEVMKKYLKQGQQYDIRYTSKLINNINSFVSNIYYLRFARRNISRRKYLKKMKTLEVRILPNDSSIGLFKKNRKNISTNFKLLAKNDLKDWIYNI